MGPENHRLLDSELFALAGTEVRPSGSVLLPAFDDWRPMLTLRGVPLLWGRISYPPCRGDTLIAVDARTEGTRTLGDAIAPGNGCDHVAEGRTAEIIAFDLRGRSPITDPDLLARLLAARVDSIRRLAKAAQRR